jgi:hypothetical protein
VCLRRTLGREQGCRPRAARRPPSSSASLPVDAARTRAGRRGSRLQPTRLIWDERPLSQAPLSVCIAHQLLRDPLPGIDGRGSSVSCQAHVRRPPPRAAPSAASLRRAPLRTRARWHGRARRCARGADTEITCNGASGAHFIAQAAAAGSPGAEPGVRAFLRREAIATQLAPASQSRGRCSPACARCYGAPPTSWATIDATRWWHLDRAPAEQYAQTESVPSALLRRWVSFPQAPAVAEQRACAISLCLELRPPSSARRRAARQPCRG